jgi:soluble lytic murein transglycosylase
VSSPTATASARRNDSRRAAQSRRRAVAARRRRRLTALVAFALVVVVVITLMPLARRAVNDLSLPLAWAPTIRQQAAEKHLDPALVAAVIYAETKFDPRNSSAGAEGPMQLLPSTALDLAHRSGATTFHTSDLNNPTVNIAYGCYYLRDLINTFHGDVTLAIAAYNGGVTNVERWLAEARSDHHRFRIADIPFPETRDYVERVLGARIDYRRTYAAQLGY